MDLATAGAGFTLTGQAAGDLFGRVVSGAGDFNGDGIDDLLISADRADQNFTDSGSVWLVFGQSGIANSGTTLTGYTGGSTGIRIDGPESGAYLGREVALADINGDGCADILLGAAYRGGVDSAYVIYGGTAR